MAQRGASLGVEVVEFGEDGVALGHEDLYGLLEEHVGRKDSRRFDRD